jgi:thioredoxin-like negative regulator of GroEL
LPVLEALAEEFDGRARFVKVEVDRQGVVLERFNASSVPAYLVFRDGVEVDRLSVNFLDWFFESRIRRMLDAGLDST